ncbi:non-ribosomal peptide synthetase [Chitinophaga varians]|uniref:non-ribosomal peptide synthetase n=1 Tax=Chitinophaga varians TaxID=2202339 RepID=UPI00165EF575|nr:non-ribosomal peptide synthetase [Chitinophaga varians]MBC9914699.1 amino acid adenylation domain-containing protein [Chitinophaga varians]
MEEIKSLLIRLQQQNIDINLAGQDLELLFDGDDLPDEVMEEIRVNKSAIVNFLKQQEGITIRHAEEKEYYLLSPAQKRLYFIQQLAPDNTGYNISMVVKIKEQIPLANIAEAFRKLIRRHESFRTSFITIEGEPYQRIHDHVDFSLQEAFLDESDIGQYIKQFVRPFDLASDMLLRASIIHVSNGSQLLVIDMHHIISDGMSDMIITGDFLTILEGGSLYPLKFQYKDYSEWINKRISQGELAAQERYWMSLYQDDIPLLRLPGDMRRPAIFTAKGDHYSFVLDEELTIGLKQLMVTAGGTLYMHMLAIMNVLFYKYTGQEDIVIGSVVAGRPHIDLQYIAGVFVNTLAMRNRPVGTKSYRDFLNEVINSSITAFEHQDMQFDDLVNKLQIERDPARNPMFDMSIVVQDFGEQDTGEVEEVAEFNRITSKFDMTFYVRDRGGVIHIDIHFYADLYRKDTIERMAGHFRKIVSEVVKDSQLLLKDINLLSVIEREQLLTVFNATEKHFGGWETIPLVFEEVAGLFPDRIALSGAGREWTYRQLEEESNSVANYLLDFHQAGIGELIGIHMDKSPWQMIAVLGILKAGGAYVPMDTNWPEDRIKSIIDDAGIRILLTDGDITAENLAQYSKRRPGNRITRDDLAYIIYTSGSTGRPKGVMLSHGGVVNMVRSQCRILEMTAADRVMQFASLSFDAAVSEIFMALFTGAVLCVPDQQQVKDKDKFIDFFSGNEVTVLTLPPAFLDILSPEELLGLRCLITAGDVADVDKAVACSKYFTYFNAYGPTECTVCTTMYQVTGRERGWKTIPIGKPIDNVTVFIVDDQLQPLPVGAEGRILVGGGGLASGYLHQADMTEQKFFPYSLHDGKLVYDTGDRGRWLPDGNIEFAGRSDEQVKIRGYRVEPGEVAASIKAYPGIQQAAVIVIGEREQKELIAFYVADADIDLRKWLSGYLPEYMLPGSYYRVKEMPVNSSGKVDRKALIDWRAARTRHEIVTARTPAEQHLIAVLAEVLDINTAAVNLDVDFFELGGHSLRAIALVAKIHQVFNVKIPLDSILQAKQMLELVPLISTAGKADYSAIPKAGFREHYPLSSAQKRLYFIQMLDKANTSYNIPQVMTLSEDWTREQIQTAFRRLIDRHESFRTSFVMYQHEPVQVIREQVLFNLDQKEIGEEELEAEILNYIKPFDLSSDLLLRGCLLRVGGVKNILLLDMHHIIADGTSAVVLLEDFLALIGDRELPVPRLQYRDFSEWQNGLIASGAIERQIAYWMKVLEGDLPRLQLQADFPRPANFTFKGADYRFRVEGEKAIAFKELIKQHGGTLYMHMLTLLNVLFYKYTAQPKIIMGTNIAGRPHADLQRIAGMFVNTLIMCNYPEKGKHYDAFLQEVIHNSIAAFENQDVQFEDLIERLQVERDPSRNPVFDICLIVQNFTEQRQSDSIYYTNATAKFDMTFFVYEQEDAIEINIEYYSDVFRKETIQLLAGHFCQVLDTIIQKPDICLGDIDILPPAERRQLLETFNNSDVAHGSAEDLVTMFERQVGLTPDSIALQSEGRSFTYRELNESANQLSHYLTGHGVGVNTVVGIYMSRGPELIMAIWGVLKSGAGYIPIDTGWPESRIEMIVKDAGIRLLLSGKDHIRELHRMQWNCEGLTTFVCLDTEDIDSVEESSSNEMMNANLWNYVREVSSDEIAAGGWNSSFTGLPFSEKEMDEYASNAYDKLSPLLHPESRVLEIGCASGITMFRIAPLTGFYFGTDVSEGMIRANEEKVRSAGHKNIRLGCYAAHEIGSIDTKAFDLIILNSVIQSFHGHAYLHKVIVQCMALLGEKGHLFIGDVMDLDTKSGMIEELEKYKREHPGAPTKTDFSSELFLSKAFFDDLQAEYPLIESVTFSDKIHTTENELTRYRYDVLLHVNKSKSRETPVVRPKKYRHDLSVIRHYPVSNPGVIRDPEGIIYTIYTSGTTGIPKGAVVRYRNFENLMQWFCNDFSINERDTFLFVTSIGFDLSQKNLYAALIRGGRLVLSGKDNFDAFRVCSEISKYAVTQLNCTPGMFYRLLEESETDQYDRLRSLRKVYLGGEPINMMKLMPWYGAPDCLATVYNTYGPTECTDICLSHVVDREKDIVSVPLGKPVYNCFIYILNEDQQLLPVGVCGEICIGGAGVGGGYINRSALTTEKFIDHPFNPGEKLYRTGDLGKWQHDGTVAFIGRVDDQVKVRGFRIELGEIEKGLLRYHGIRECVVLSLKEVDNQQICAYYVADGIISHQVLSDFLSLSLPDYMIPAYFIRIDAIPLTGNGKVNKKALPAVGHERREMYVAPASATEQMLTEVWSGILGHPVETISTNDSFFLIGGHSLRAVVLVTHIHKTFNVRLPLKDMFMLQTIRKQAAAIDAASRADFTTMVKAEKSAYYPLSSAQKRLYFIQQMDTGSTSYNMPMVLRLQPGCPIDKIPSVFQALIERHASFRTSFILVDNQCFQRVYEHIDFQLEQVALQEEQVPSFVRSFIRPFDLGKDVLLRACLITVEGRYHVLVADMHHIISDGTTGTILAEDFLSLLQDRPLSPLKFSYVDYSAWQNQLMISGEISKQEEYWKNLLAGEIPRLYLPTDFKRPSVFTFRGDRCSFRFEKEVLDRLKALNAGKGGTLYMNVLALLNVLLFRYTGQSDIIIGTGIAGRPHADLQHIAGMFVNTLVMRNKPTGDKTFSTFLHEVINNAIEAFTNQDVQFEDLVDQLQVVRDPGRNPLFDVSMVVQNYEKPREKLLENNKNWIASADDLYRSETSKFDITFFVHEEEDSIDFIVEYYTDIFRKSTIERLISHFKNLVEVVLNDPDIPLGEIKLYDETEKEQLLFEFNDTVVVPEITSTLPALFAGQVIKTPDRTALMMGPVVLTYRELDNAANQLAHYLIGQGIGNNDRVGIYIDRSIEQMVALLGILKTGAAYVPLDTALPEERVRTIINDGEMSVLVSQKKMNRELNRLLWSCSCLKRYLCIDSDQVHLEQESTLNAAMSTGLWEFIGETAVDDISGGGWVSSYTGQPFTRTEMDEYGDNVLEKVLPLVSPDSRVLEIGCASGITMFRVAPHVGLYYGTDLSGAIIARNKKLVQERGINNIRLDVMSADQIDQIDGKKFDLIIINSVIQSFHGHNYLRQVLEKCITLLDDKGYLFVGDVMDQDLKEALMESLMEFRQDNPDKGYHTKLDFSSELFLPRDYFRDLQAVIPGIAELSFTPKIHTTANELTRYRYDVLISIDKTKEAARAERIKFQDDRSVLMLFPTDPPLYNPAPKDIAYVIYTSGTSGKPKGVEIRHDGVVNLIQYQLQVFGISDDERILQFSTLSFDASVEQIWLAWLSGSTLVLVDRSTMLDPVLMQAYIREQQITHLHAVPMYLNSLDYQGCTSLRRVISGGDVCPPSLFQKLRGIPLYNEYGPTETTVTSIETLMGADTGHIGRPVRNTQVYILDSSQRLQPIGVPGELCISGAGMAAGYLRDEPLTLQKFIPHPFRPGELLYRTGDKARWLEDGNIAFLGRLDEQVKIRGFRIEPDEIVKVVLTYGGAKEAVVVMYGAGDDRYLCCYVTGLKSEDIDPLRRYLAVRLPEYMIPGRFVRLEQFPLTITGKIDHAHLPDPMMEARKDIVGPEGETEWKLAAIWSEILGVRTDMISVNDSFFELGGHSLKATVLVANIHQEFNVKIPLATIFMHPTIREIGHEINGRDASHYYASLPVQPLRDVYRASAAQERFYILQRLAPDSSAYNMPMFMDLPAEVGVMAARQAIHQLIARHEILRTSFEMTAGGLVQRVHQETKISLPEYPDMAAVPADFIQPFLLNEAPLIRAAYVSGKGLLIDMHHIITDAMSQRILETELKRLLAGEALSPVRLQYRDFAEWQQSDAQRELVAKQLDYWENVLSGPLPRLHLPTDKPRPALHDYSGAGVSFSIDPAALKQFASAHNMTLYIVLMGAFQLLLSKITGQSDILTGTPVAGRRHADLQAVTGPFVNTLVVRTMLKGDMSVSDYYRMVRDNILQALDHQEYPFELLVEKLVKEKDISRNPIFDVMFNLLESEQGGGTRDEYTHEKRISKFDLSLMAIAHPDRIVFELSYSTALFNKSTIDRLVACFERLLEQLPSQGLSSISSLDILSVEERDKLLLSWNKQPGHSYEKEKTISMLFEEQVARTPERTCVVYEQERLTFAEVNARSNQLANILRQKGIGRQRMVGLLFETGPDMIIAMLAVMKAGATYVPIDPSLPPGRIALILKNAGAVLLLSDSDETPEGFPLLKLSANVYTGNYDNLLSDTISSDPLYIIFTSGTTGQPKGVMINHQNVHNYINWLKSTIHFDRDKTALVSSYAFDLGYTVIYSALLCGNELHLLKREKYLSPEHLAAYICEQGITYLKMTPSLYSVLAGASLFREAIRQLRVVLLGGEMIQPSFVEQSLLLNPAVQIVNHYGPTEATIGCIAALITTDNITEFLRCVTIGRPIFNTDAYILGDDRCLLPPGAVGELYVSGDGLSAGYWGQPELTDRYFIDHPFHPGSKIYNTGDLASFAPDGKILLHGRKDQQVKLRGYRIELHDIETALISHPMVKEGVVILLGAGADSFLCAYVKADGEVTAAELKVFLQAILPDYMIPGKYVFLDTIPLTHNGKVDRWALPAPEISLEEYEAPEGKEETGLAEIWAEVLSVPPGQIGRHASFFALGGNSLNAIHMITKVGQVFDTTLSIIEVFKHPVLKDLAKRLPGLDQAFLEAIDGLSDEELEKLLLGD